MIIKVRSVRHDRTIGQVKLDENGKVVEGDDVMALLVTDVLRRSGGKLDTLDGWTNGYVQLKAS